MRNSAGFAIYANDTQVDGIFQCVTDCSVTMGGYQQMNTGGLRGSKPAGAVAESTTLHNASWLEFCVMSVLALLNIRCVLVPSHAHNYVAGLCLSDQFFAAASMRMKKACPSVLYIKRFSTIEWT